MAVRPSFDSQDTSDSFCLRRHSHHDHSYRSRCAAELCNIIWPLCVPISIHFDGAAIASLSVLKSFAFASVRFTEDLFLLSSQLILSLSFPCLLL